MAERVITRMLLAVNLLVLGFLGYAIIKIGNASVFSIMKAILLHG